MIAARGKLESVKLEPLPRVNFQLSEEPAEPMDLSFDLGDGRPESARWHRSPLDLARRLVERGDLWSEHLATLNRLRKLRNHVIHDGVKDLDDSSLTELKNLVADLQQRWHGSEG
jgi:hypothetical protein